jgi:hypothetical protein
LRADIVAKVENRTTPKISQMLIFANSATAVFRSANTKLRDRFCAKRCGPSYRRARNASAVLKNFGRLPKKTFATISAPFGPADRSDERRLSGEKRKWLGHRQSVANDPNRTSEVGATDGRADTN